MDMDNDGSFWRDNFPNWLNNFGGKQLPFYKRVIRRYRKEVESPVDLVIKREAYDYKGNLLKNCFSLHYMNNNERGKMKPFWKIYNEERLKENKEIDSFLKK